MKHEAAVITKRQRYILIAHQYIRVLVEDMAVASLVLLIYLIVVTLGNGYMYAVLGSCEQCIVNCAVPRNDAICEEPVIEEKGNEEEPDGGNIWTRQDPEPPQEPEPAEGELFADEQIEKVIPEKKPKKSIFNVLWTKAKKVTEEAKEKTGKLLDEISEEEV